MDFKKRIIEELEMTDIQADTLYKGYVQVAEKLAKEYHTEQLRIAVVSNSDCKGGYLLKNNECKKYGGICVKCNCDYWQSDC